MKCITHSIKKGQVKETKQHLQCGNPNKENQTQNKMILVLALVQVAWALRAPPSKTSSWRSSIS